MNSLTEKLEWHNKGDSDQVAYTFTKRILDWIESQIKDFLIENKISVKNWKKHGVIQCLAPKIGERSYILYYKTRRKELKRKITVVYNHFIK